jgi:hypothetical protein
MLVVIFHLLEIGYKAFVLSDAIHDAAGFSGRKDAWMAFRYNLGLAKSRRWDATAWRKGNTGHWWGHPDHGLTGSAM